MRISFADSKLEKICSDTASMRKRFGTEQSKKLQLRLAVLLAADSLQVFAPPYRKPERCHELLGGRSGQLSMDLAQPYRLIFIPDHDTIFRTTDGGLDWRQIRAIKLIEIVDTH